MSISITRKIDQLHAVRFLTPLLFFKLFMVPEAIAQQNFWEKINGPYGGVVQALAIDSSSGNIFAGVQGGGVFRSADNGQSWTQVNSGLPSNLLLLDALAINSSRHIFVGTTDGVFRSTDNGNTWTAANTGLNRYVKALAINSSGHIFAGTYDGLFRSMDNGNTWKAMNLGFNRDILSLAINFNGDIFAGINSCGCLYRSTDNGDTWQAINTPFSHVWAFVARSGYIFAGSGYDGVYRSTDNGNTWTAVNSGLTDKFIRALAIDGNGYIFAGTAYGGVFRSIDDGNSWTAVNEGLTASYIGELAINAIGNIFAGTYGGGIFFSANNPIQWTPVNTGISHAPVNALAINKIGHIFTGIYNNIAFRSTDNGDTWTPLTTGPNNVRAISISTSGEVFAGNSSGIFHSTDNGNVWVLLTSGLRFTDVSSIAINKSGHIFAGASGAILRSTDNGTTWAQVTTEFTNTIVQALAVIDADKPIFAGTYKGVFRSTDNGNTWTQSNTGLTNTYVSALAINSNEDIFAGTLGGGVFRSTDNGDAWIPINTGLVNAYVRSLIINPIGLIYVGTDGGVFLSTDNGNSWVFFNTDLKNSVVYSFAINPFGYLLAGTFYGGIFRSTQPTFGATVTTASATNVTSTSATLNGTVNPKGLNTAVKFEYGTTISFGNMVNATPSSVSGSSPVPVSAAIDSLSPSTTYHYRVMATNSAGTTYGADTTFTTSANRAPTIVHTLSSPQPENQAILIQATISDDFGTPRAMLKYRQGGRAVFDSVAMTNNANSYQGTIPASAVTSRGVEYFIETRDAGNLMARFPIKGYLSVQVQVAGFTKSSAQPNGSAQTAYRLVSVPYQLFRPSPEYEFVDNLGPYDNKKWRLYGLINGQYVEYPNAGDFTPGRSMFLIVRDPGKIITSGAGQSIRTDKEYQIFLQSGDHFVATPFNFPIPLSQLRLASRSAIKLQTYRGQWLPDSSLVPWEGCYMANNNQTTDTLFINPDLSQGQNQQIARGKEQVASGGWQVRIHASAGEARDTYNFASVAAGSNDGWDDNDWVEPPPIGEYVSLYFFHQDWQKIFSRYTVDSRSPQSQNYRYDFEVESNITGETVTLKFDQLQDVPDDLEIALVDYELDYQQNLRENAVYQFQSRSPEKPKQLTLLVGKQAFIAAQTAGLAGVPEDFALRQNFPNPFNPETVIRFDLPVDSRVTLKIFDITGREVATLVDNEELHAGRHQRIWIGKDTQNWPAATGIYFYQLVAGSFAKTAKMTLVR